MNIVEQLWTRIQARDWDGAGALLHDELVVEWPVTAERIVGREAFLAVNREQPGAVGADRGAPVTDGHLVAADVEVPGGGEVFHAAGFYEVRDGLLVRGVEYWTAAGAEQPPPGREQWVQRS